MTDDRPVLAYGTNPGCVVRVSDGRTPHQCGADEAAAVPHVYLYPRRHATRLYVCEVHAGRLPESEPLSNRDRAIIRARHTDRDRALRAAGRLGPNS